MLTNGFVEFLVVVAMAAAIAYLLYRLGRRLGVRAQPATLMSRWMTGIEDASPLRPMRTEEVSDADGQADAKRGPPDRG